jgi:hypothetical protein
MPSSADSKYLKLLLPLAALLAMAPLLWHGGSCGQDEVFHIQSWLDAAQQLQHGHDPTWATTAAWNAGEPRFIFYPPLSWLLGALLITLFPAQAAPIVYIFLALTAAGLAFYKLASEFVSTDAALLASAFYLANPYMLFNALERSAFAELLAAAWIPLLLLAVLRSQPTARGIAIPLALLWLTNAPAAVMGSYTLALLAALRIVSRKQQPLRLVWTYLCGTVLGLALPAFYLMPAAIERKYVQVAMAIIPNMRYQDNFLFTRTADAAHNAVNHTISALALSLLALTVLTITTASLRSAGKRSLLPILAVLTTVIAVLLVPLSTPLWQHLPELAFLQFPWRLLTILSPLLALALAVIMNTVSTKRWDRFAQIGALALPLALGLLCFHLYAQACEPHDTPANIAHLLATHHGLGPTDEYTPTDADNDYLRTNNPGYWLATSPNAAAPNTTPTATELHPDVLTDDNPVPVEQTLSTPAPHHILVHTDATAYLILNLRDYPNWEITATDANSSARFYPGHNAREDGLLALTLSHSGNETIDIVWHRTLNQNLGLAITILALLALALTYRSRSLES